MEQHENKKQHGSNSTVMELNQWCSVQNQLSLIIEKCNEIACLYWEVDGPEMSGWGNGQYFSYNFEILTFLVVSEAGNARSTRAIAFPIALGVETFEPSASFCTTFLRILS